MAVANHRHQLAPDADDSHSWLKLLAQLLVDFTKVVEAEARLARASIEPALTAVLSRWLLQLMMASVALAGSLLLLGAVVLLLHKWMELWAALAVVGGAAVAGAICGLKMHR